MFGCGHYEKTADDMFEKLGYVKIESDIKIAYKHTRYEKHILLGKLSKTVNFLGKYSFIELNELKAINQKCKELGWINKG